MLITTREDGILAIENPLENILLHLCEERKTFSIGQIYFLFDDKTKMRASLLINRLGHKKTLL
jgi:hypothetical protein